MLPAKNSHAPVLSLMPMQGDVDVVLAAEWMEAGRLKPVLDRAYSLPEAPAAVRYVEGCHARGKVTVTVH